MVDKEIYNTAEWGTCHMDPTARVVQKWEQSAMGASGVGLGGFTVLCSVN